jgi:hypothetical protein
MIARPKALGLLFIAVLALSAVAATAAQATAGTLTSGGKTVKITGEQVGLHEFTLTDHEVSAGKFATGTCEYVHFHGVGTVTDGATQITVEPTYGKAAGTCIFAGQPATITTTGCDYLLKVGENTGATGWHVTTDVECTGGNVIKIVTGTCEVHVGSQTGLTTSQSTNTGAGTEQDLLLHTKIGGIKYTVTKDAIGCPLKGTGTFTNGDYNGTTTVKGFDSVDGLQVGIKLH